MATVKVKIHATPVGDGWVWHYDVRVSNGLFCSGGAWSWQGAMKQVQKFAKDVRLV